MPLTITAIASLGGAAYKLYKGRKQAKQASELRQVDVTPEGQKQNLAAAQLAAASGRMPGQDVAQNQIEQSNAAYLDAARKGATGGGSVLAALGRGNGQRLAALSGLGSRVLAYGDQARARLAGANATQAGYDDKSRMEYVGAKTALDQASSENQMGALTDVANTAAFYASNSATPAANTAVGDAATAPSAYNYPGQSLAQRLLAQRRMRAGYRSAPLSRSNY